MPFPFSQAWNESDPADTDLANQLGDDIRDLKLQIRERMEVDHNWPITDTPATGYTKMGSARPYYQGAAPANNPGAPGAVWVNSTTGDVFRDNGATWDNLALGVPQGAIVMWSGLIAAIPAGWKLCDGTSGTPDLRSRFIRGAPAATDPGAVGGADSHVHSLVPSHVHQIAFDAGSQAVAAGGGATVPTITGVQIFNSSNVTSGDTVSADGRPAYFELAFIMKA